MMKLNIVLMLVIMVSVICPFAQQGPRYAFVVGVGDYKDDRLDVSGPVENAEKVANTLERVGFSKENVVLLKNPTKENFEQEFTKFHKRVMEQNEQAEGNKLKKVEAVVFFFVGHGAIYQAENYLFPNDIEKKFGSYSGTIAKQGIKINDIVETLKGSGEQFNLILVEACAVKIGGLSIKSGFAPLEAPEGTSVMLAASEGKEATMGFFSNSLLEYMEKPGLEIDSMMTNIKDDVHKKSAGKQSPTRIDNKRGKFYFIPPIEDPLEPKMKEEKESIKKKVNELVKLPSLPKVNKAITQKEYDRYALQEKEMAKKYEKIEEEIGKYEKEYKEKTFYETLENELLKANNYIERQRTLLERAEMYSNRNSQTYGLPENIWNECCVQEDGEYILDMTTPTWKNLSWKDQMKCAKIYQESYAIAKNLEVRKEIELGEVKTGWFSKEKVSIALRLIPPGAYLIGTPENEKCLLAGETDDQPQTYIVIAEGFYLSETEVTQGQWQAIMGNNPSYFTGDSKLPVEQVSWLDARDYCLKLTEKTRKEFRLPLEVEWEYGCRAGTTTPFNIGPIFSEKVNFYRKKTVLCGSLSNQNAWGLYDMHGNVYEWCLDEYKEYTSISHHPKNIVISQYKDIKDGSRVDRDSSWGYDEFVIPFPSRSYCRVGRRDNNLGFRLSAQQ